MLTMVVGLVVMKAAAMLVGPSGVGAFRLYQTTAGTVGTFVGLGISRSGIRSLARLEQAGDLAALSREWQAIHRASVVMGLLGWCIMAALSVVLSRWAFNDASHSLSMVLLGSTVFMGAVSAAYVALMAGRRRIGDRARASVAASLAAAPACVALLWALGEAGIWPWCVAASLASFMASRLYAARCMPPPCTTPWLASLRRAFGLARLGISTVVGDAATAASTALIAVVIARELGVSANGIYAAAWSISGFLATFVLNAMGADFYPRLSAVQDDRSRVCAVLNEQIEVGLLLAVPGLLFSISFSGVFVSLLYSQSFQAAADLMPIFAAAVFLRVTSWPLGYLLLAKGAARQYAASELIGSLVTLGLCIALVHPLGLIGIGIAHVGGSAVYNAWMLIVARRIAGYRWSGEVVAIFWGCLAAGLFVAGSKILIPPSTGIAVSSGVAFVVTALCFRGLAGRLGSTHRVVRWLARIPLLKHWVPGDRS